MLRIFLTRILSGVGAASFPSDSKSIKAFWIHSLLVVVSLQPHLASGANTCLASGAGFPVVDLGPLTLPADTPIGPVGIPIKVSAGISCTRLNTDFFWYLPPVGISSDLYSASGPTWIFKTNLQGVGISVTALSGSGVTLGYAPGEKTQFFELPSGVEGINTAVLNYEVQYYKFSGRPESGVVMAKDLFASTNLWGYGTASTVIPGLGLAFKSAIVKSGGCSVTNSAQMVKLRGVSRSELSGGEAGRTPFNIHLVCDPGSIVKMTMTDVARPSNVTEKLTLGPGSTAVGVTLGIRNADGLVKFGPDSSAAGNLNQWLVAPSEGLTSVPLTVQYLATGDVTPGTINGLVSFTLSYQ